MNIFVYSDESGVFDREHNANFVYGGVVFLDKGSKDNFTRKYCKAERDIKTTLHLDESDEAKASVPSNKNKGKLYRSLNHQYKIAC